MKILKVGCAHPEWKRECECTHCGTTLEVERANLFLAQAHDMGDARDRVLAVCAVCQNDLVIQDPASSAWGTLARRVHCLSCRQTTIVSVANLRDPYCTHCNKSVELPKPPTPRSERW